nr:hypothetical protein [uncultured Holophaga sp.]
MGNKGQPDSKTGRCQYLEEGRKEREREFGELPRLCREDLEHPEGYHQRLHDWIIKQGRGGRR